MAEDISVIVLATKVQTEGDAYAYMEQLRWGDTPTCAHCGQSDRVSFLNPENGVSRRTRTGAASERRVWFCGHCRKQFSVTTNTILHGSKVSLRKWLFVAYEMCANKNGIAAREIQRKYKVTPKTAWLMTQRLREAMKHGPFVESMRGTIVADEARIGGKARKSHMHGHQSSYRPGRAERASQLFANRTAVLSLIDTESGEVRSRVDANVEGDSLKKANAGQVDMSATTLLTDAAARTR